MKKKFIFRKNYGYSLAYQAIDFQDAFIYYDYLLYLSE